MEFDEEFKWSEIDKGERAAHVVAFHEIIKGIAKSRHEKIGSIYAEALGPLAPPNLEDTSNFRKGEVSAARAEKIYRYLAERHFEEANRAEPRLFTRQSQSAWEAFIEHHAVEGALAIIPMKRDRGIVERVKKNDPQIPVLRLEQPFCLQLTSPITGVAIAFQAHRSAWHAIPLGPDDRNIKVKIKDGQNWLPRDSNGNPIMIAENDHLDRHSFVVITSSEKSMPQDRQALMAWCREGGAVSVHKIECRFVV